MIVLVLLGIESVAVAALAGWLWWEVSQLRALGKYARRLEARVANLETPGHEVEPGTLFCVQCRLHVSEWDQKPCSSETVNFEALRVIR